MFNIVDPSKLSDEMLLSEVRNINSICKLFNKELKTHLEPKIPDNLVVMNQQKNKMFFVDKGKYTEDRYNALKDECGRRGLSTADNSQDWNIYLNTGYYNDYEPTEQDVQSAETYVKFVLANKWSNFVEDDYFGEYPFHYYGKEISFSKLISLL